MGKRIALWLTDEEAQDIEKLKQQAKKDKRSLNSFCKIKLFKDTK
jgi:hypothetical protein